MKSVNIAMCLIVATAFAGCAAIPEINQDKVLIEKDRVPDFRTARPPPFLRSYESPDTVSTERVQVSNAPLFSVLKAAIPGVVITPVDSSVDMAMQVSMMSEAMTVPDFLTTLQSITNLEYRYKGNVVEVASFVTKEWRMPSYTGNANSQTGVSGSGSQSGGSGGSGVPASPGQGAVGGGSSGVGASGASSRGGTLTTERENDEWEGLIATAERYADNVIGVRSQGLISATGRPLAMRELDRVMRTLQSSGQTIIALDVSAFEVSLNDSRARGIDWSTLFNRELNFVNGVFSTALNASFPATLSGSSGGGLNISTSGQIGSSPVELMLNLLSEFGEVELSQQPKVTTLNGKTAFVGSGEEFGFLSEVRSTVSANLATVEPTIRRILIGVELSITPVLLDDGRIMVEVTPIISNFRGFDEFSVGGNQFSQPRIALQQLSTTTIARAGEPIQIGGLIQSRLTRALNGLPLGQKDSLGIAGFLFESEAATLSRSELVIMITPTLVGG